MEFDISTPGQTARLLDREFRAMRSCVYSEVLLRGNVWFGPKMLRVLPRLASTILNNHLDFMSTRRFIQCVQEF